MSAQLAAFLAWTNAWVTHALAEATAMATAFLAWVNAESPLFTAASGGGLALLSALLFLIATALGPDVHVFPCLDQRARFWAFLTSFSWFIRGVMVLTTIGTAEARKPHWDMPLSWIMTTVLLALVLVYIWAQRMPAAVASISASISASVIALSIPVIVVSNLHEEHFFRPIVRVALHFHRIGERAATASERIFRRASPSLPPTSSATDQRWRAAARGTCRSARRCGSGRADGLLYQHHVAVWTANNAAHAIAPVPPRLTGNGGLAFATSLTWGGGAAGRHRPTAVRRLSSRSAKLHPSTLSRKPLWLKP